MYNKCIIEKRCKPYIFNTVAVQTIGDLTVDVISTTANFWTDLQPCALDYRKFFGVFAFEWPNDNNPVYISAPDLKAPIPLRSACGGFQILMSQLKCLCNARKLVPLANCYDTAAENDHINIQCELPRKNLMGV